MISILQVIEVFRNVIRVQSPQPHTTKKRHLKQLQLFQISMAKDTGPKTALFWMTPRTAYREVLRSDSGWNVAHMLMSVSVLANGQVSLWKVGSFFDGAKKECHAWCDAQNGSFGVHVHGLESYCLFDVVFLQMSTVLLLASCEHLNQALDIRADIIWHAKIWHVFCHSTTSAFVSSDTKTAHSTQPSIQIQSKTSLRQRLRRDWQIHHTYWQV